MDWLIFGDDWGAHPSTTQHLARHLPSSDRIVWVDSIGMRAPSLVPEDLKRALSKLRTMTPARQSSRVQTPENMWHIRPRIAPWHAQPVVCRLNRLSLRRYIGRALRTAGISRPHALLSNPLAGRYLGAFDLASVSYLRLDDYSKLPGVNAGWVKAAEDKLFRSAGLTFATAKALLPSDRGYYLPQGVDFAHFADDAAPAPPQTGHKVLGFFGLLAEWVDFELIEATARAHLDWQFEFLGPVRYCPDAIRTLSNVTLREPVPYAALPAAIKHWHAAWIPFEVSELTAAVNPLKLREYLAAGLPTACTPLPEALVFGDGVSIISDCQGVGDWLDSEVMKDTAQARTARRELARGHGWGERAALLRTTVLGDGGRSL